MGREVRRVPKDWEHLKDSNGSYVPLHDGYNKGLQDWDRKNKEWSKGYRFRFLSRDGLNCDEEELIPIEDKYKDLSFEEWSGERPKKEDYMPDWPIEERTYYQMYEDTSEGTPISPVMETPEKLAAWLVENGASAFAGATASYDGWLRVARGRWAPSAIAGNGKMNSGVDG